MARVSLDSAALGRLIDRELQTFEERTKASQRVLERASRSLPLGVPSSFQHFPPHPIYISRASGSRMWDADGNEYIDFHMGFGALAVGHAHPRLVEALSAQLKEGILYAMPSEDGALLAEELCRRFRLDMVRFSNSGTEATMDALRLARGVTGRDMVVKIEGSYHGHHDYLMVSVKPPAGELGPLERPAAVSFSAGIPREVIAKTLVVPYNRPDIMARTLEEYAGKVAAVILEPVMMNIGIVHPESGYLQALRDITSRHGVVLIFDEVKTGATIAAGGACELYHVQPDLVCLAKSIGGGVPIGAFGGRRELMEEIKPGSVAHLGTFNGNPLAMKAGLVTLTEILTPQAYERFEAQQQRLVSGCQRIIEENGLPMYSTGLGAKGCVMFIPEPVHDYRGYLSFNQDLAYAHWLYLMNRDIFMPPGFDEQWTLCVQHSDDDLEAHLAVFEEFARDVMAA